MARWRSRHFTAVTTLGPQEVELEHSKVVVSWLLLFHVLFGIRPHRHKQICRTLPGLGGREKFVYVFFVGSFLMGEKTHKQNPPKKRDNLVKLLLICFFALCVFFAILISVKKNSPKEVFGWTSLRTSGQKLRSGAPNSEKKTSVLAWTRRARRPRKKLRPEKLRADFRPYCYHSK